MISFVKTSFFNPIIEQRDTILINSSEYDLKIKAAENSTDYLVFRIRFNDLLNCYVAKRIYKFATNTFIELKVEPNSAEYLFLLNCFFGSKSVSEINKLKINDILNTEIRFNIPAFDIESIKTIIPFSSYRLLTTFKFKGTLFVSRFILDNTNVLDIISGSHTAYALTPYKAFKRRVFKFNTVCNKLEKELDIPWIVIKVTLNYVYYNPKYKSDFITAILLMFKHKREKYMMCKKLPFKDILIINGLNSSKDEEKEKAMAIMLSEEQFNAIKYSLYGSRNINIIAKYIIGETFTPKN